MDLFILIIEIIGTVAFSVSGAMIAIKKNMDVFGVMILGLTTSVGGGIIRDLILGVTPPMAFRNPVYALVALVTAALVFPVKVRRLFRRFEYFYEHTLMIMDTVGLAIFTVVGVRSAVTRSMDESFFLLLFVGVITGVGGGVMRDVLAGYLPYIFVKHIYACASLAGCVVCILLWNVAGEAVAMVAGAAVVLVIRFLSAHYRWSLPKAKTE